MSAPGLGGNQSVTPAERAAAQEFLEQAFNGPISEHPASVQGILVGKEITFVPPATGLGRIFCMCGRKRVDAQKLLEAVQKNLKILEKDSSILEDFLTEHSHPGNAARQTLERNITTLVTAKSRKARKLQDLATQIKTLAGAVLSPRIIEQAAQIPERLALGAARNMGDRTRQTTRSIAGSAAFQQMTQFALRHLEGSIDSAGRWSVVPDVPHRSPPSPAQEAKSRTLKARAMGQTFVSGARVASRSPILGGAFLHGALQGTVAAPPVATRKLLFENYDRGQDGKLTEKGIRQFKEGVLSKIKTDLPTTGGAPEQFMQGLGQSIIAGAVVANTAIKLDDTVQDTKNTVKATALSVSMATCSIASKIWDSILDRFSPEERERFYDAIESEGTEFFDALSEEIRMFALEQAIQVISQSSGMNPGDLEQLLRESSYTDEELALISTYLQKPEVRQQLQDLKHEGYNPELRLAARGDDGTPEVFAIADTHEYRLPPTITQPLINSGAFNANQLDQIDGFLSELPPQGHGILTQHLLDNQDVITPFFHHILNLEEDQKQPLLEDLKSPGVEIKVEGNGTIGIYSDPD